MSVSVRTNDPLALEHLSRFATSHTVAPRITVTHVTMRALATNLDGAVAHDQPVQLCSVFATGDAYARFAGPMWPAGGAFRRTSDGHWVIRSGDALLSVARKPSPREPARLLREIMLREGETGLILHASGVADQWGARILAGPSGSGKTTLALALAEHCGMGFIGNDYIFVRGGKVSALPVVCRVGAGTVHASPQLQRWASNYPMRHGFMAATQAGAEVFGSPRKYEIPPMDIAKRFGCQLIDSAALRIILVPALMPGTDPVSVERIPASAAVASLAPELRVPVGDPWGEPWIQPRADIPASLAAAARLRLQKLCDSVPVLRVTVGLDTLCADPAAVARSIAAALPVDSGPS